MGNIPHVPRNVIEYLIQFSTKITVNFYDELKPKIIQLKKIRQKYLEFCQLPLNLFVLLLRLRLCSIQYLKYFLKNTFISIFCGSNS